MPGQVVENFRRWSWKLWGRRAHIWGESSTLASDVPHIFACAGTGRISWRSYYCRKRMEDNFIRASQQIFAADSC
jgi:hypothetical protein